jgi:hypothetical protein
MANEPSQPYSGPLTVDLTVLGSFLADLNPGGMQRLRREKEGMDGVVAELARSVPGFGAAAGVSPDVYASFLATNDKIAQIRAARAIVGKLYEVLTESEVLQEHNRENEISIIVDAVKSMARRKDDSILAPFEKTLKYNAQSAEKAAKTRRKNLAEAEGQDGDSGEGGEGQGPADPK